MLLASLSSSYFTEFIWAIIFLVCGIWIGRYSAQRRSISIKKDQQRFLPRDYFVGLNFLLKEQPDKALDVFIKMVEVDSETVETHLALATLFRKRGEVERAIRIHQNLIARPNLAKPYRTQALLELGQDYLKAGVFDRAEKLFLEVIDMGEQTTPSLQYLLDIYQQEKDWEQAIKVAEKLERSGNQDMQPVIAHYYCEIAEKAQPQQWESAQRYVKRALAVDRNCVRASLLEAQLAFAQGQYKNAINACKRVKQQDADFIVEAMPLLIKAYEKMHAQEGVMGYLRQSLDEHPRTSIMLIFAERLREESGPQEAVTFLTEQLQRRPSIRGLEKLIEWQLNALPTLPSGRSEPLSLLQQIVRHLLQGKPNYQCRHCGYSSKTLVWQCPSCKYWNTVKPIHGVEGD